MSVTSWWQPQGAGERGQRRARLQVEHLEDRIVPAAFNFDQTTPLPPVVPVGQGNILTTFAPGEGGPALWNSTDNAFDGATISPNVTSNFTGPYPTNKWWSPLMMQMYAPDPNRVITMHPDPLAMRAYQNGLGISYPTNLQFISDSTGVQRQYEYPYQEDFNVTLAGLNAAGAKTDSYTDWTVTAAWQNGGEQLKATFGEGLPFVYFTRAGQRNAMLTFSGPVNIWYNQGGVLGVTVNGHNYGIFGPSGSAWTLSGNTLSSSLNGQSYFSVGVLPNNALTTLQFFRQHAYAFVTGAQVSWQYNPTSAQVATTFNLTTQLMETTSGYVNQPLTALFEHQWLHTNSPLTNYTFISPQGTMKLFAGSSFTTTMTNYGSLPLLPMVGANQTQLYNYINQIYQQSNYFPNPPANTYETGKELQLLASLIPLSESIGFTAARDKFLTAVESELNAWFRGTTGQGQFVYDQKWSTLLGFPDAFGTARELNDHNLHYGYFVMASAIVAQYDPVWAQQSNWGGMVDGLIRDVADSDRTDLTFPFLRNFDAYAGHSWESGHANFFQGNNEESSSEAINFDDAVMLWGAVTGDTGLRDLGAYLYTTEVTTANLYWFNQNNDVFPNGFQHNVVGQVWGDAEAYQTWWTTDPVEIHGINFLPSSGGSIYLGRNPGYVMANYNHMLQMNGGPPQIWQDRMWQYLAFAQPSTALSNFNANPNYPVSDGESEAHTDAWLSALNVLGQVDTSLTADTTFYAVFNRNGVRTYAAYNPTNTPIVVHFSNGFVMNVPALTMLSAGGQGSTWTPHQYSQSNNNNSVGNTLYFNGGAASTPLTLDSKPGGGATAAMIGSAGGQNYDGAPHNPLVFTATGLTGTYDPTLPTIFNLFVDAGNFIADGTQVQIAYDFNGDGVYDRIETYRYFATNNVPDWEDYTNAAGLLSATGAFANFVNGSIRVQIWEAIGNSSVALRTSATAADGLQSSLTIPFKNLTRSS